MTIDLTKVPELIHSSRPPSFDLLGESTRRWKVVYMTPPWLFKHRSKKGDTKKPGGIAKPSIGFADLASLPLSDLLEKDAIVFVWAPDGQINKLLSLFDIWGLRYNGFAFYWARTREDTDRSAMHFERDLPMSTGYITRSNPIPLVMGVRGEPSLRKHLQQDGSKKSRKDIRKLQFAPYTSGGAHPMFRDMVEQLYDGPYLELFGPGAPGWDHWNVALSSVDKES